MTDIQALNAILVQLGGTTAHTYNIQAYNAWSVLQGGTGTYTRDIDALNAIDILNGGSGGHRYNIDALNSINVAAGGVGTYRSDNPALVALATLLNPFASDLSLLYNSYDSGYIRELSGLDAQIVGYPELVYNLAGMQVADNGALDIAATGEISIAFWFKTGTDITTTQYVLAKNVAASINGRYGIYIAASKITLMAQDSAGSKSIASANVSANTWYHVAATYKDSDKVHLYINKIEIGTGVSVLTFAALNNVFKFCVGSGNSSNGLGTGPPLTGRLKNVHVFNRIISLAEIEDCYNEVIIGNESAMYRLDDFTNMGNDLICFDLTTNKRHLTFFGNNAPTFALAENNNNNAFLYGYDLYFSGYELNKFIYVPHKPDGTSIDINSTLPAGYYLIRSVPGSVSTYNMAPVLIDFNPAASADDKLDILDRSNDTIQTVSSRSASNYDATKPHRYASFELNINTLKGYFETDYKWRVFPQISDNSVYQEESYLFKKLLVYTTQKLTAEKETILQFTGDKDKFYTLDYYYEDRHISAQRGNKVIFCDGSGLITLSNDSGATTAATIDASADLSIITFAHIFENGNILFCGQRNAYLSSDNLTSYAEIAVTGFDGNAYNPVSDGVFRSIGYDIIDYSGQELLVWGCYSTEAGTQYDDINVWFSANNGESLRSIYKFGELSTEAARHIHGVSFNRTDNTFWIQTGDAGTVDLECHWIKGTYDGVNFTWLTIQSDNGAETGTFIKSVGFCWFDGYMYWGTDKTGASTLGLWRVLYSADLTNSDNYESMGVKNVQSLGFKGENGEMIMTTGGDPRNLILSCDGKHFYHQLIPIGAALHETYNYLINLRHKNADGYYVVDQTLLGQTYPNFTTGQVLMIKINKNN